MDNSITFTEFDKKLIKILNRQPSMFQLEDDATVRYAMVMCVKNLFGIEALNPVPWRRCPLTPEECTHADMERISKAGYDLVIEDGIIYGWRKRDE